jgi:hypothetical protein
MANPKFPDPQPSAIMPPPRSTSERENGVGRMQNDAALCKPNELFCDADIFSFDIPDAALEQAARAGLPGGAMSFPNAPTVSILIMCCSVDGS